MKKRKINMKRKRRNLRLKIENKTEEEKKLNKKVKKHAGKNFFYVDAPESIDFPICLL